MVYNPITQSHQKRFKKGLTSDFPAHFHQPIVTWIVTCEYSDTFHYGLWGDFIFKSSFIQEAQISLRCIIPGSISSFFSESDLVIEVLNFFVQNHATPEKSMALESILCEGGHAYKVAHIGTEQVGLERRVSDGLEAASREVLNEDASLREAWQSFYKKDPDLTKTVSKCVDALETKIKNKYYPKDQKPSLGKFLNQMKENPSAVISYIGKSVDDEKKLFEICSRFANFRGQHTSGTGQNPTKEDAEFILHTSILLYHSI